MTWKKKKKRKKKKRKVSKVKKQETKKLLPIEFFSRDQGKIKKLIMFCIGSKLFCKTLAFKI